MRISGINVDVVASRALGFSGEAISSMARIASDEEQERPRKDISLYVGELI